MRSFKTPLFTAANLPNLYPETNVIFSPDDRHILTGVGKRPGGEKKSGEMVVLSKEGLEVERRVDVGEGSVIRVAWHSRINQVRPRRLSLSSFETKSDIYTSPFPRLSQLPPQASSRSSTTLTSPRTELSSLSPKWVERLLGTSIKSGIPTLLLSS